MSRSQAREFETRQQNSQSTQLVHTKIESGILWFQKSGGCGRIAEVASMGCLGMAKREEWNVCPEMCMNFWMAGFGFGILRFESNLDMHFSHPAVSSRVLFVVLLVYLHKPCQPCD